MPSPRACYWPRAPNAASMPKYYLWHNDLVGRLFLDAMLQAADRGVRVRLLIDDMTLGNNKDIGMVALDAHANVEVRVFNPFTRKDARWLQILTRFDDVTRRMHTSPLPSTTRSASSASATSATSISRPTPVSPSAISTCSLSARSSVKSRQASTSTGTAA